jgi:hypothetical protein
MKKRELECMHRQMFSKQSQAQNNIAFWCDGFPELIFLVMQLGPGAFI